MQPFLATRKPDRNRVSTFALEVRVWRGVPWGGVVLKAEKGGEVRAGGPYRSVIKGCLWALGKESSTKGWWPGRNLCLPRRNELL